MLDGWSNELGRVSDVDGLLENDDSKRETLSVGECHQNRLSDQPGLGIQSQCLEGRGPEITAIIIGQRRPAAQTDTVDASTPCVRAIEFDADAPVLLEYGTHVAFTSIKTSDEAATFGESTHHPLAWTPAIEDEFALEDGERRDLDDRDRRSGGILHGDGKSSGISQWMKHDRKHAVRIHQITSSAVRSVFETGRGVVIEQNPTAHMAQSFECGVGRCEQCAMTTIDDMKAVQILSLFECGIKGGTARAAR